MITSLGRCSAAIWPARSRSQIEDAEHANRFRNLAQQIESDRLDVVWVDGPARYHEESGQAGHDVAGGELSNVTLTGVSSGESELGLFMAIETLSLGVEGKHPCGGC